jgi:biotin carboxyl carrier protein
LTFEIEAGGRTRIVEIERRAAGYRVTVDGREHIVDVAKAGAAWSMLIGPTGAGRHDEGVDAGPDDERPAGRYAPTASIVGAGFSRPTRSYEVAVLDGAGGATVYVNGQPVPVSVAGRGQRRARQGSGGEAAAAGGPQQVVAPMPGRIVKVLVRPGDTVAPRQGLVVVEAMKMENELRSPKAGTVADVRVTEGMSVEAHAVLVVVT